jgi:hypothetical protein
MHIATGLLFNASLLAAEINWFLLITSVFIISCLAYIWHIRDRFNKLTFALYFWWPAAVVCFMWVIELVRVLWSARQQ